MITPDILNQVILSHRNTFPSSENYGALALKALVTAAGNTLDNSALGLQSS